METQEQLYKTVGVVFQCDKTKPQISETLVFKQLNMPEIWNHYFSPLELTEG